MVDYVGSYHLDARPDRIDLRDRSYTPPLKNLANEFPARDDVKNYFPCYEGMVLDQGKEGACTGFGLACAINYLLWRKSLMSQTGKKKSRLECSVEKVSSRMLYHLARFYDEWPGEDYNGSSCRGAVKAWHKHGVCSEQLWPYHGKKFIKPQKGWEKDAAIRPLGVYYRINKKSITDMQAAIQQVGAIYVSAKVHAGWNLETYKGTSNQTLTHNTLPRIEWKSSYSKGSGHAFAFVGYNKHGFIVQNSWGPSWGEKGFAVVGYDDWKENATDAWVCVMGAPSETRAKPYYVSRSNREHSLADNNPTTFSLFKKQQSRHEYKDQKVKPWNEEQAYYHSVVMGNDGKVINRLLANEDALDTITDLVVSRPSEWLANRPGNAKHLVIYAHGGLNSEDSSLNRIRTLAPYFKANGVYPLFFTWKTGLLESIVSIMGDSVGRVFPSSKGLRDLLREAKEQASDVLDRTLEVASGNLGVKAIWSQMKQNAGAAALKGNNDRGLFLTVKALAKLKQQHPTLKIHLIGHSAGSILQGHLLDDFPRNKLTASSCTLYAAACTVDFAYKHYVKAINNNILKKQNMHMHLMTDIRERDDTVGPYRKSLLYLVSRALEDWHKTPLLGLSNAFDPSLIDPKLKKEEWNRHTWNHLKKWQEFWGRSKIHQLDNQQVITAAIWKQGRIEKEIKRIDIAHGSFDNDVEVIDQTIRRITGQKVLKHAVENLGY